MHFLEYYYKTVVKYELIQKFQYKTINTIPGLKKIVLILNCKNSNIKKLVDFILAMEILTGKKGCFISANQTIISIKVRKGNFIGCKLILKKTLMYNFFSKLLINGIFSELKINNVVKNRQNFVYHNLNLLDFSESKNYFYIFNNLSTLEIVFVTINVKTIKEFIFLFNCFKLFFKQKIY